MFKLNFGWFRRKEKRQPSPGVEKIMKESQPLDQVEVKLVDEERRKYSLDSLKNSFAKQSKKRQQVDVQVFLKVKRALSLKKQHKFYKSEQQIANRFGISQKTVAIIRRTRSFRQYQQLRKMISKGRS